MTTKQTIMPRALRRQIEDDLKATIPAEYTAVGYHFCYEWDDMIVGPNEPEWEVCQCNIKKRLEADV